MPWNVLLLSVELELAPGRKTVYGSSSAGPTVVWSSTGFGIICAGFLGAMDVAGEVARQSAF